MSDAEQFHRRRDHSRRNQLQMMLRKAEETGEQDLKNRILEMMALDNSDPMGAMVNGLAEEVIGACATLHAAADPARIVFEAVNRDDATATSFPYADGSCRVVITDGLISMIYYLCVLWAWSLDPEQRQGPSPESALRRLICPWENKKRTEQVHLSAALLRYHHVHHRVFGKSAKLEVFLEEEYLKLADMLQSKALQFILAHEVAHFMLGHRNLLALRNAAEVEASRRQEQEADRAAVSIMNAMTTKRPKSGRGLVDLITARSSSRGLNFINLVGIVIAMTGLHTVETALFLRRSHVHLKPAERIDQLAVVASRLNVQGVNRVFGDLLSVTDLACDTSAALPRDWWQAAFTNPRVSKATHSTEYLNSVIGLDGFHSCPAEKAEAFLRRCFADDGMSDADAALDELLAGSAAAFFRRLGITDAVFDPMLDRMRPLTFHTVQDEIFRSPALRQYESFTSRRIASVVLTRLLELRPDTLG